jgi:hypothetical protein
VSPRRSSARAFSQEVLNQIPLSRVRHKNRKGENGDAAMIEVFPSPELAGAAWALIAFLSSMWSFR